MLISRRHSRSRTVGQLRNVALSPRPASGRGSGGEGSESRATSAESRIIQGYGAVYYNASDPGTEYWLWDDIVERIKPGAFDNCMAQDIRGLFNHDSNYVLGRTTAGTMRIKSDDIGLHYEIDESPNDPMWASVAEKITRGDVTGSSFAFHTKSVLWEEARINDRDVWIRWINTFETIYDFGPVTFPAYAASTSSRTIDDQERSLLISERNRSFAPSDMDITMRMRMLELD